MIKLIRFIIKFVLKILGIFVLLSVSLTLLYKWIPVPITPLMVIRLLNPEIGKIQKEWISLDKISEYMILAVIVHEDQNFFDHTGFDFNAIQKAWEENNKKNRIKRGASTISQQTAKNVFLWPQRSWARKGLEVWFTFLIETFWSKKRILEVYLNVIETGKGLYGVEAASSKYFGKPASKLSPEEAALIAAILPAPLKLSAINPGPYIKERQKWVLKQMQLWGMQVNRNEF